MAKCKYDTYVKPNLDKVKQWAKQGATIKEIAQKLNIGYSTFKKYMAWAEDEEKHPELQDFRDALTQGKNFSDDAVEAALFKKTQGYNAPVKKHYKLKEVVYDPETGKKVRETEKVVECFDDVHVPADTNAQIFWLTNRRPENWRRDPKEQGDDKTDSGVVEIPEARDES